MADRFDGQLATDVVVVGGGATGCGVARDLAMRGVDVTLVERGSLNAGTTGRSHGVLHSGARYADEDPESAVACREEQAVLRRIAGAATEETGGYFLQLERDDDAYFERKLDALRDCGIDADVADGETLRDREPDVTPDVVRAIEVPDAVVSPARLVAATAASAREYGATILTDATVTEVDAGGGRIAVEVERDETGASVLGCDHVVNAAGAWAGRVAALAGVDVTMAPTRGLMVVLEHAGVGSVLNRCRPPGDGDIVVPHEETVVAGTTSVPVTDPDESDGTDAEVATVRSECAAMVPSLVDSTTTRAFWGVRPLYDPGGREATRGFQVLDHAERDGVPGMTTVVGGKLTTYRRMGEAVADHVAGRLGVEEPSRTAEEPLPGHDDPKRLDALVEAFGAVGPADLDVVGGESS